MKMKIHDKEIIIDAIVIIEEDTEKEEEDLEILAPDKIEEAIEIIKDTIEIIKMNTSEIKVTRMNNNNNNNNIKGINNTIIEGNSNKIVQVEMKDKVEEINNVEEELMTEIEIWVIIKVEEELEEEEVADIEEERNFDINISDYNFV